MKISWLKKKLKGWWQCGERYMLSTWGFGCAHGRVGGSSSRGVLEVCWQTFCCNSGRNELPSVLFLPPSPQVITAVSPQREHWAPLAAACTAGKIPTHFFPLHLLCQQGCHYATILLALPLLQFNPPLFRCTDGRTHQVSCAATCAQL